ncbi:hypothetical protein PRECH8_11830 [Insulibacter thermoxylanivorax]|uniref:HTH araC/xylS-type domain-containing protein n=1 Tax=Insulibacter thermoxylanivorax TaxID=2749268 RepID=A0A916QGA0_9BACL|nr:hypothetical protein PRECH8_11830 [Insulibacter thermoxylanivorax]
MHKINNVVNHSEHDQEVSPRIMVKDVMMPELSLQRYLPHIKQQVLRELLTNKTYGFRDWVQLKQLLNLDGWQNSVRLILLKPQRSLESEYLFALANIAEDIFREEGLLALDTMVGATLVFLVDDCSLECLARSVEMIRYYYKRYYRLNFMSVYTDLGDVHNLRRMFKEAMSLLNEAVNPVSAAESLDLRGDMRRQGLRTQIRGTRDARTDAGESSDIVASMIRYIHEHLSDPALSLQKLSKEVFYMNSDYLGKLFLKQTGEKFSRYVMRVRMEKAVQYMLHNADLKILDIAALVGFPHNVQYFSQVFKKMSGYSPSQYRDQLQKRA